MIFDEICESIRARYTGNDLSVVRSVRGHGSSTKNRSGSIYKRSINRGNVGGSAAGVTNTSRKDNNRRALSNGLGGVLRKGSDGKRTTKTVGKRVNSALPCIVSHLLPNGDAVIRRDARRITYTKDRRKLRRV